MCILVVIYHILSMQEMHLLHSICGNIVPKIMSMLKLVTRISCKMLAYGLREHVDKLGEDAHVRVMCLFRSKNYFRCTKCVLHILGLIFSPSSIVYVDSLYIMEA